MDFWIRLKELIKAENTTQEWVANRIGKRRESFNRWISKKIYPQADEAYRIARALNTTVEFLVDGEEGTRYLITYFRNQGIFYEPPARIADLVSLLNMISDEDLKIVRATTDAIAQRYLGEGKPVQISA